MCLFPAKVTHSLDMTKKNCLQHPQCPLPETRIARKQSDIYNVPITRVASSFTVFALAPFIGG